jgi:tRNA (mo5U34)-methyltransferase
MTRDQIASRIAELGEWFQNFELAGVPTAPGHFLGNYPENKWQSFRDAIPADLTGKSVLDIGCNAGFYSLEMKRRSAERVLGIDFDLDYLAQARFAAQITGLDIEFRELSVYDLPRLGEQFDLVLFMGVFYHLRHPLLALDLIHEHVARDLLIFQSMQRGAKEVTNIEPDYPFEERKIFEAPGYPVMHFVENRYSRDPTNWWIPNRSCVEAMLRSAGFEITAHPEEEVYICHRRPRNG